MRVTIVGTGYVGLVTGVGLAALGHRVVGLDIDPTKVERLQRGISPIYEEGLEKLLRRLLRERKITFTTQAQEAVAHAEIVIIAVGTPPRADGSADLQYVHAAARSMAPHLRAGAIVVNKSTVPVGTAEQVATIIQKVSKRQHAVVSCPEFLREGKALEDFFAPDRIVVGSSDRVAARKVARLFAKLKAPTVVTDSATAELIKYASNAFLATKISFINELANVCELVGADVQQVAVGMGADGRIGQAFLQAGESAWGVRPAFKREGGSVPVVSNFQHILDIETVNTGFGLPTDNMHGPNEKLHLPTWYKGIEALIHFFFNLAE